MRQAPESVAPRPRLFHERRGLPALLLILFGFLLYGNSLGNGYSIDDYQVIENHAQAMRGVAAIPEILTTNFLYHGDEGANFRPMFTDATSIALPGLPPVGFPRWGVGVAAGDYDGDGWTDLYFTHAGGRIWRNKGDGTFEDITATANLMPVPGYGAAWGDIDNDGDLDLYVTGSSVDRHFLYINSGLGTFNEEAIPRGVAAQDGGPRMGHGVSFGDYDNDGFLDIYVTEQQDDANPTTVGPYARLFRNQGTTNPGYFDDVTIPAGVLLDNVPGPEVGTFPFLSSFSDLDDDGLLDLAVVSDHQESRLFWNNGDGTFTDGTVAAGVGTDENGMGASTQDYDGDGLIDWFVTSIYEEGNPAVSGNRLYRNLGNRTFSDEAVAAGVDDGSWGWGAEFFDYDNDGDLDLAMANGFEVPGDPFFNALFALDPLRLWRNEGNGTFTEVSSSLGLVDDLITFGLLAFDYDKDGDLDVLINHLDENAPVLFRNDGGNAKDWLQVELTGLESQIDGIGAVITVTPIDAGPSMTWEMSASGTSPSSQYSGITAHFGLGQGLASVHEVSVRWPRGGTRSYSGVAINSVLHASEPPVCDDQADNDGDGLTDFPADPGCAAPDDPDGSERSVLLACDDGIDNGDGDSRGDFDPVTLADAPGHTAGQGDPGCASPASPSERPSCQDGVNNNPGVDSLIDFDGGQSIHGQCGGGVCPPGVSDPDLDGVANPDPKCVSPWSREKSRSCGLGFELALLLPILAGAHRGRRRSRGLGRPPNAGSR